MSLPLHRLNEFILLERREAEAFCALAVERRQFGRHDVIRREGAPTREVYFLVEGWAACRIETATGDQQIAKVHLPGDILGAPSLALAKAGETLVALTRASVDVIPATRLGALFSTSPRLAAALFFAAQQERVFLMDRLASIGRTSAAQRLVAFLLSLYDRLMKIDPDRGARFELPLSQKQLADVLGITTVHANRTFRQLDQTGMIRRSGREVALEDVAELRRFCGMPQRDFRKIRSWLSLAPTDCSP